MLTEMASKLFANLFHDEAIRRARRAVELARRIWRL